MMPVLRALANASSTYSNNREAVEVVADLTLEEGLAVHKIYAGSGTTPSVTTGNNASRSMCAATVGEEVTRALNVEVAPPTTIILPRQDNRQVMSMCIPHRAARVKVKGHLCDQ